MKKENFLKLFEEVKKETCNTVITNAVASALWDRIKDKFSKDKESIEDSITIPTKWTNVNYCDLAIRFNDGEKKLLRAYILKVELIQLKDGSIKQIDISYGMDWKTRSIGGGLVGKSIGENTIYTKGEKKK